MLPSYAKKRDMSWFGGFSFSQTVFQTRQINELWVFDINISTWEVYLTSQKIVLCHHFQVHWSLFTGWSEARLKRSSLSLSTFQLSFSPVNTADVKRDQPLFQAVFFCFVVVDFKPQKPRLKTPFKSNLVSNVVLPFNSHFPIDGDNFVHRPKSAP